MPCDHRQPSQRAEIPDLGPGAAKEVFDGLVLLRAGPAG